MSVRARRLDWDGCRNVRDLGGLPTAGGGTTRRGAVVRADAPDRLSTAGWAALESHGVRTIIDLRNHDELDQSAPRPAPRLDRVHLPLERVDGSEFWDDWAQGPRFATPHYYAAFLELFPERPAAVIRAIVRAPPGGVLIHCGVGRDRTGLVSMLLLHLAGVCPDDIADDYELSSISLAPHLESLGREDEAVLIDRFLTGEGTSARELVISTLASLDIEAQLRRGGLGSGDLAALRARLVAA